MLNHLQHGFNRQRTPSISNHSGKNGLTALGIQGLSGTFNYPEIDLRNDDRTQFR